MPLSESNTGLATAASDGPSLAAPTSGLTTDAAWTSWSYCLIIHSLLQTFQLDKILNKEIDRSLGHEKRGSFCFTLCHCARLTTFGNPSCKNSISRSQTVWPLYRSSSLLSFLNSPIIVASTSSPLNTFNSALTFLRGTASIILSCASDIHISV